jgi:hypothetical protein
MELVSVYCFGEQLPNPDLVRKFIGYVIKNENETEDFTPFDGQGIDVTPVIRSYILQQLLAIKERYVVGTCWLNCYRNVKYDILLIDISCQHVLYPCHRGKGA